VFGILELSSFCKLKYLAFQKVFAALKEEKHYLKISHPHIQMARINIIFPFINVNFPLNAELNPICHLLALLGAHHILHISRIRV